MSSGGTFKISSNGSKLWKVAILPVAPRWYETYVATYDL